MSEVLEKIKSRKSIRKFKSDMIPREVLEQIVEAGTYAATGMNRQSPVIVAVTNRELRDKLSRMHARMCGANHDPFYGAPVVLLVLADKTVGTGTNDGSLVMGNMMLAAHDLGIGSCWVYCDQREFESEEGKELIQSLGIEGEYAGIAHCILGYVDGEYPKAPARKENWVYFVE